MKHQVTMCVCAALLLAIVGTSFGQPQNLLVDPGFELGNWTIGWPAVFGEWGGDLVEFVGENQGIVPHGGALMVHHIASTPWGPGAQHSSQIAQNVDLSSYRAEIDAGLVTVRARVWVNRIQGTPSINTAFYLSIIAYNGGFGNPSKTGYVDPHLISDGDPTTWEQITAEFVLPASTDRVMIDIAARENITRTSTGEEFAGHYSEDAFMEIEIACYADCDQSTGVGVLDVFDFLCFQNSFVSSEPYACDCDTSTGPLVCDVFDFLCFQNAFVGGCP